MSVKPNSGYNRVYCDKHPERRKKSWRDYNSSPKRKETTKRYRDNNREKVRDTSRIWANRNYQLNGRSKTNDWERRNEDRVRSTRRKWYLGSLYNLSEEDFLALLRDQENLCAICETEFDKTPFVDHDHETGKIRGLLCRDCNSALGMFKDNLKNLTNAIEYLCK